MDSQERGLPARLAKALSSADAPVRQAFLQIIEAVKPYSRSHKPRGQGDYCFYAEPESKVQFCGIVPQVHRVRVGVKNRDARVSSRILELKKVPSNPAWEECWIDPSNPAHVPEAIRIIVEVSRVMGGPGGPSVPPQTPLPTQQAVRQTVSPPTLPQKPVRHPPEQPAARAPQASPDKEAKRAVLIQALRSITPEMRRKLEELKREGAKDLDRDDWIWNALLGSFSTMGNSRGYDGLINNLGNYRRVTFEALSALSPADRLQRLDSVLHDAGVRMPGKKAEWLHADYGKILDMCGLEEVREQAFAQRGTEAKIAFLMQFDGVGPKYGRNIWMDSYHPDFRETIAIDERIRQVTMALGYSFANYTEHEQFYQAMAHEAGLQGWELDRLLYQFRDDLLATLR